MVAAIGSVLLPRREPVSRLDEFDFRDYADPCPQFEDGERPWGIPYWLVKNDRNA